MIELAIFILLNTAAVPIGSEAGIGTTYGLGGYHGDVTADGSKFRPREEATCAHKTRPLGSWLVVRSGWQFIVCQVTDRGPYVVKSPEGLDKAVTPSYRLQRGERWTRIVDLSVRASKMLGRWGKFDVTIYYWESP